MSTLDQIAITIELTLISIIEGFALQALAASALPVLRDPNMMMYVPYILGGMLFLLVFWSQSILHAISFIRWPTRIGHMLLYFVAAFVQVIIYGNLTDPVHWFFWASVFSAIILGIYWLDLGLIRDSKKIFTKLAGGMDFMHAIEKRHIYEFKVLAPSALIFNVGVYLLIFFFPMQFIGSASNIFWLGVIQAMVSAVALWDCVRNFTERTALIGTFLQNDRSV